MSDHLYGGPANHHNHRHQQSSGQRHYEQVSNVQSPNTESSGMHSEDRESDQLGSISQMIDPNDPILNADPFGLSASMHYPTNYSNR